MESTLQNKDFVHLSFQDRSAFWGIRTIFSFEKQNDSLLQDYIISMMERETLKNEIFAFE